MVLPTTLNSIKRIFVFIFVIAAFINLLGLLLLLGQIERETLTGRKPELSSKRKVVFVFEDREDGREIELKMTKKNSLKIPVSYKVNSPLETDENLKKKDFKRELNSPPESNDNIKEKNAKENIAEQLSLIHI